jgi:hypothetical protein
MRVKWLSVEFFASNFTVEDKPGDNIAERKYQVKNMVHCFTYSSTLKMQAILSWETSVDIQRITHYLTDSKTRVYASLHSHTSRNVRETNYSRRGWYRTRLSEVSKDIAFPWAAGVAQHVCNQVKLNMVLDSRTIWGGGGKTRNPKNAVYYENFLRTKNFKLHLLFWLCLITFCTSPSTHIITDMNEDNFSSETFITTGISVLAITYVKVRHVISYYYYTM